MASEESISDNDTAEPTCLNDVHAHMMHNYSMGLKEPSLIVPQLHLPGFSLTLASTHTHAHVAPNCQLHAIQRGKTSGKDAPGAGMRNVA